MVILIRSMTIKANSKIVRERIWINRFAIEIEFQPFVSRHWRQPFVSRHWRSVARGVCDFSASETEFAP